MQYKNVVKTFTLLEPKFKTFYRAITNREINKALIHFDQDR